MKIQPANRFILDRAAEFGEVVMVLGGRKSESASRAQVMNNKQGKITGSRLGRHHVLSRAYVYTPIEDFITDDVWTYLLQVPNPWGSNNRDLAAMYQSAQSGECPLVVDDTTPSCGNSRFGCWTCTVVTRDKSMEAMIDSGEEWMLPLLEFRDWLAETQDPAKKHLFRRHKRRTGEVLVIGKTHDDKPIRGIKNIDLYIKETGEEIKEGMIVRGPYEVWFRQEMLRRLLHVQNAVRATGPDPKQTLITEAELHEIRRLWRTEEYDWADSLPQIYEEVTGQKLAWLQDDIGAFSAQEYQILDTLCDTHDLPIKLVAGLLEEERQMQGMHRRSGIFQRLDAVLGEEWRNSPTQKAWQQLASSDDTDIRIQRAAKVQVILDEYLAQITQVKLNELEQMVAHYFNLLCRKQMIVQEVQINPQRFTVRLYGRNRVELPKASLSAGEKQLYAMALLWALRSVSGRNLPIIIDTPMGRLDSTHRHILLTRFFPEAANQIILLSTDTEIDEAAYRLLEPAISHTFVLDFDNASGRTSVKQGYFAPTAFGDEPVTSPALAVLA